MSAHKKKRIGSRRRVVNQNETSEADELHQADSLTIPQHCTPDENKEPLNVFTNPHGSLSETQNPPSPELSKSRRKLGSSRKSKEREHVKDSTTKSYNKPTEGVEENIKGNETPETTQISLSIQPQRQEELGQGSVYGIIRKNQEVRDTHQSEDAANEEHVQDLEIRKEIDHSFEIVSHGNLIDQTAGHVTYQPEFVVKSTDDCAAKPEDSNRDDKSGMHSTEGKHLESSEQANENYHVYENKKPVINDTESVETGLEHKFKCQTENELKPSAELTHHQEQKEIFSESQSSLQTLNSEMDVPLDTQSPDTSVTAEEQTPTGFNPNVNRRKLGSTRRNKGWQLVEESVAESYHERKEEVLDNNRDGEALETEQMMVAIERTSQEELSQGSEHDTVVSVTHDSSLFPAIMPDYSSEVQTLTTSDYPKTDPDSWIQKSESHPEDEDETEIDSKVEVLDKSVGATLEGIDKTDTFQDQEVRDTYQSEDTVNKEFEIRQEIDHSFETVSHDFTESSEMISGNLIDQTEGSVTYQPGFVVKSTDDCAAKPEDSNRDDKSGMHSTEGKHLESSEQANEDYHVYENKKPVINDTESVETGQEHKFKGQTENELKPSAELTHHQEQKEIFSESQSSLQTLNSEMDVPLETQSPDTLVTAEEQTPTGFNPNVNRRKLGSTRRNKGRQLVEESVAESYHERKEEVLDNNRDGEALETEQMMVAIERTSQEELSQGSEHDAVVSVTHDSSLFPAIMPDYSSEVQTLTTSDYPKTDPDSWIQKSESHPEDEDETEIDSKVEVLDKSVGATLEGIDKTDTFQDQEVRDTYQSEDTVNKEFEIRQEIDHSFETVSHDFTESSEMISGNLIDQTEGSVTYQPGFVVKSTDDCAAKPEDSNRDDKSGMHSTEGKHLESSEQANEDYRVYENKKPVINDTESVETGQEHKFKGQTENELKPSAELTHHQEQKEIFSESQSSLQTLNSEMDVPLETQSPDTLVTAEEQTPTGFNPNVNRRKLGSTRRNKGRQLVEESVAESYHERKEEVLDNNRDGEALETEQMMVAIERTSQEELSQGSEHDTVVSVTHDSSLFPAIMPDYSSEVQTLTTSDYPKTDPDSWIQKSESHPEDEDETEIDSKVEVLDKSVGTTLEGIDKTDTFQDQEVRDTYQSEDTVNKEFEIRQEIDHSFETVSHDFTESSEMISGNLIDQTEGSVTYQPGFVVKSTDDCAAKPEDSNRDDKSGMHSTEGKHLESSEQANEDYHVYENKKPVINDTESVETGQEHKFKGQTENELKPSAELTHHQEQKEIFSESQSSLQTLNSEMDVPLETQSPGTLVTAEEQTPTGFNPNVNRRKLGSTRRNKGRQLVEESVAESYHERKEEVLDNNRDGEALETEQMMVAIERTSQEELSQGSEHDAVVSVTHDSSLFPAIMPDYSSEVQTLTTSDYPKTDPDSWIQKSESHPEDEDETEIDSKVEVLDKSVGATLEGIDKTDTFQDQEVRDTYQSEDTVNKEFEIRQEIDHSFETVSHDFTESSEMISGNLIDQTEGSVTYQPGFVVKSTDDCAAKPEDSNRDDKSGMHSTEGKHLESSEQANEDYRVYENKKPVINDTESVETGQEHKFKGQTENELKPSAELTHHQEQKEIFSESQSSLQTLNSEMDVPLETQSPGTLVTAEEQTPTGFNPNVNRRKLGSTRRNKGRQLVEESVAESYHERKEEVLDNNRDGEALETEQMMVAIERTSQEELSQGSEHDAVVSVTHDSSLFPAIMPDYSSEVQTLTTSDYPKTDPDSWIQKSESHPEDEDETEIDSKVEVLDKSVGATLEGIDKTDTFQDQEVRDTYQSEDTVNKEFEIRQEIDHSFETVSHDFTESSEMISGNLIDQTEGSVTYQPGFVVKSTDDCAAKPEDSNRDDKSGMHSTEGKHLESSEQANEDYRVYENKKPVINDTESVETGQEHKFKGQTENELKPSAELTHHQEQKEIFSESQSSLQTLNSEMDVPLETQSPDTLVTAEEQTPTGFNPNVNRRKLGSTRRNKGRQLVEESVAESYHERKEEVLDNNRDGEALETEQMMVAIERTSQEELSQGSEHDAVVSVTHDSSLFPAIMPDYSSEVQTLTTSDYPKTDPDSWIQKSESHPEDEDETEIDSKVEVLDKSVGATLEGIDKTDTFQDQEVRDTYQSEDTVNKEFEIRQEIDHSFETVSHDFTESSEMISGNLIDQTEGSVTYQPGFVVKSTDDCAAMQDDDKSDVQTRLFSEMEEKDSFLQTLQSDIQSHLDSKPQYEDTNFKPIGNRRKLGSSRRQKGRQHAKDSYAESYQNKEEESGNTRNNTPETAVQLQDKLIETMEEIETFEITHMGEVNDQVTENARVDAYVDTPVGTFKLSTSSIHSSLTVDQQLIDQADSTEMQEDELINLNSVIEKESKNEKDGTELLKQDGNSQDNISVSDSHLKPEKKESSHTQELFREKHSHEEHMEPECSVEQAIVSSPKEELPTNEEQNVNSYISQVKESLHLDDVVNELHEEVIEPTQMQEVHQVHFSSVMESESYVQTLQESEEQTPTGFNSVGNRRKLGSSRRHKGRQLVKECVTDPFHKPKEEFVENRRGGDVFEQKDACHIQKTEALSCEKDSLVQEINMQPTNDAIEAVRNVTVKEINTEVKSSMGVQVFGQNEVGEKFEDPLKRDSEAQVISASQEMMHAELFLAAHNTADTLAQFDLKEKSQVQLEADLPEEGGISALVGADSQQGIQETLESNSENLEKSKQRRRKMGSTRRTQLNREPADGGNTENESEGDFNMKAGYQPEAVTDIKDGEQTVDINVETSKLDDFTGTGIHITSELTERTATNTDVTRGKFLSSFEATQRTQNDEEMLESVNVIQAQALKSAEASVVTVADLEIVKPIVEGGASEEHSDTQLSIQDPNDLNEEALTESFEMKNSSPNLNSARRRKMGSTRKSLSSRSKREDFHQKQVEDNEAIGAIINSGNAKTESYPGIKEKEELQLHMETKEIDSEQRQEKLIETVEYGNTGESHLKQPSNQTFEEKPVSPSNLMETEHLLNPNYFPVVPSTSPTHDVMSETAGGRKRKLGSSRKSRGQQSNENQTARKDRIIDTQSERDVRSVIDESAIETTTKESLGLAKISEVDENDQKPLSNISTEHPRPVSEKTAVQVNPVQQPRAETRQSQESQKTFSLSSSTGADRSNAYNVLMVGDSSVGKTSFIKRAQSGKFSLDLPASVGIDSCMWTVVVEGRSVVLKLWDTAGQERFHSITRQIFHKAQAFLLMYDITSSQSFAAVRYWLNCIQEGAAENVTIVLLGNKSDHAGRQVQSQEGKNLAKDYGFEFMECSAATGENVINSLETVARMLSQKPDTREETSVLHKEPQQKKSSGCC